MYQSSLKQAKFGQTVLRCGLRTLAICTSMWAMQASAAVDFFLAIDGIEGESADAKHAGSIDVLVWSWGLSSSTSAQGKNVGRTTVQDFSFTQYFDKATPQLIMSNFTGELIPTATLTVRKAGEKPLEYLKIVMEDVLVTSNSTGGSGGEDILLNNVTLNFKRVCVTYTPQKRDGTGDRPIETCWDVSTNKAY